MTVIKRFFREDQGTATIETVLMLPLLIAILSLTVDLSLIFNSRAEVLRIMQDTNRNVSIGRIEDAQTAESYVKTKISHLAPNAMAQATITAGVINTTVWIPASDLMMTGFFDSILRITLTLSAQHMIEDWEA
ncbi:pilus assembly protein [Psychromarinibacter sp. C21-152]|uniref:Pilus assembly protein n=1 Tax=Psychromarinibacter sediminicola TaxID=3033385 RepID=A0AAE3TCP2_9RHOB|nr:TadE/TadG family type IV pilus assembly protein [Psychromarinibacter sediminicola]MDF0603865.1 pilus assembly protein [Psychromarinibacter sediminicola]